MYPDPIARIRSQFEGEIYSHYRYLRQMFLQQLRGEITRPKIDTDQIVKIINALLNTAGNRVVDSAWRHLDSVYKTGLSNAQGQINLNTSVVSSYSKEDADRTDAMIDACSQAVGKQNQKLKADILKILEKDQVVSSILKTVRDQITQVFIPEVVETAQTFASATYNEAVWSRIATVAPEKRWCFVSDRQGQAYHQPMNDITIPIDQPFLVASFDISKTKEIPEVEMMYPHDHRKKPHQLHISDCRCYVEPVF